MLPNYETQFGTNKIHQKNPHCSLKIPININVKGLHDLQRLWQWAT